MAPMEEIAAQSVGARPKRAETPPGARPRAAAQKGQAVPAVLEKGAAEAEKAGVKHAAGSEKPVHAAAASGAEGKDKARGRVAALWTGYLLLLERRPVAIKSATAAFLAAAGNIICQLLVERASPFDAARATRFIVLGAFIVGPALHVWYGLLNRCIPRPGLSGALLRLVPDQLLFSPPFNFVVLTFLLSSSSGHLKAPSAEEFRSTLLSGWAIWPAANLLIFWLVPAKLQLLASNVVALLWNTYLSTKAT